MFVYVALWRTQKSITFRGNIQNEKKLIMSFGNECVHVYEASNLAFCAGISSTFCLFSGDNILCIWDIL